MQWHARVASVREGTSGDRALAILSCGFVLTMVAYGWFQEQLSLYPVPAPFVVLVNNLAAALVAYAGLQREGDPVEFPRAAWGAIVVSAMANTLDSTLRYAALRRLSFTAVLVLRGLSLLPSLAFAQCLGVPCSVCDWLLTLPVVAGVVLFGWNSPLLDSAQRGYATVVYGVAMASGAAVAEAFNSQWQSRIFRRHAAMSPLALLLRSSLCSAAISAANIVARGNVYACVVAIRDEPSVLGLMLAMACFASLGRVAIFEVLHRYGGFVLGMLLLVRRLLSVGLSSYNFGPMLTGTQLCGVAIVFASLLARSLFRGNRNGSSRSRSSSGGGGSSDMSSTSLVELGRGAQRESLERAAAGGGGGGTLRARGESVSSEPTSALSIAWSDDARSDVLEPEMLSILSSPRV